jgi:hypothetical protein
VILLELNSSCHDSHSSFVLMMQWAYNVIRALQQDKDDIESKLMAEMLTGAVGPHVVLSRCEFWEEMAETFADVAALISNPEPPQDKLAFSSLPQHLASVFPSKTQECRLAVEQLLLDKRFEQEYLSVSRISAQEPTAAEKEVLKLLWTQQVEEIAAYEAQVRGALLDSALQSRRSKPQGLSGGERYFIKADDLRTKLNVIEPNKCQEDIANAVHRAFRFSSFSDTLAAINPQDNSGEDVSGDQGAYRAAMFSNQEPVEHVMLRLGTAGLLRTTMTDAYGSGSAASKLLQRVRRRQYRFDAVKGISPGSPELDLTWQEVSTTRIIANESLLELPMIAAVLKQEKCREKAIAAGLQACTQYADDSVPHWAKIPYILDPTFAEKTYLELMVIQHCNSLRQTSLGATA